MLVRENEGKRSQWEIEEDFRTLQRAREIMKDEKKNKRCSKASRRAKRSFGRYGG